MNEYKPQEIEEKWQKKWESDKTFSPDLRNAKKPYYNLMMFPYPSAEGLHVGNMYAFTGADVYGRFQRMRGNDVFEPIGLDGFGIHSENYALKVGRHPREQAKISEKNFYRQLRATGNAYDWQRTLETYDPDYYRWTQWLFIQMFKKGLAYRKKAQVNWCPRDLTVLADEQVIDGRCERDGAIVEKRDLEQWFFKITDYADVLLSGLNHIDWPERIKIAQRNWIGKSEGAKIEFKIQNSKFKIGVFTTRPDTLYGATFMVLSPEHPVVASLLKESRSKNHESREIREYVEKAKKKTEKERIEEGKEKTGVFSGLYAINPVNEEKIPVWIADYVLMGYGTGAIMAVPAHDQRDFEFAKKYDLPIRQVIVHDAEYGKPLKELKEAYDGPGGLVNSGDWDDYAVPEAMPKILDHIEQNSIGRRETTYHLRDWLISRQRYWGPPIPMIYCSACEKSGRGERKDMPGWWTEPEDQLPVLLPDVEDWKPEGTGTSPLANHPEFYETKCPSCSSPAKRETDVSDTFLDSAWYYLRYLSIGNENDRKTWSKDIKKDQSLEIGSNENLKFDEPYDINTVRNWCPVAIYIGGAEHSVLHLLYVRFIAMVLHDLKNQPQKGDPSTHQARSGWNVSALALPFQEPFPRFFAHGLIVKDRAKMSKSKGNIVIPDTYISKFGADTLRLYLMFLGPFSQGGDFRDSGIEGMYRFVRRVWNLFTRKGFQQDSPEGLQMINKTIKEVTKDIEDFGYNTAIARLMEFYNFISQEQNPWSKGTAASYLKLLAPFAPHLTEELFQQLALGKGTIHKSAWPEYDEKYLVQEKATVIVQIDGKKRGEVIVDSSDIDKKEEVERVARKEVEKYLSEKNVKNVIYVPGRIMNFVI